MNILSFSVQGKRFYCIPDDGSDFDWLVGLVGTIPDVRIERHEALGNEVAIICRGADSIRIYSDPIMGGPHFAWPDNTPPSQLVDDILEVVRDSLAPF